MFLDICRQTPDEGHCGYSQSRWYYDPNKGMCLPFVYKGCGGNKNRFKNSDLCMRFCAGVRGIIFLTTELKKFINFDSKRVI